MKVETIYKCKKSNDKLIFLFLILISIIVSTGCIGYDPSEDILQQNKKSNDRKNNGWRNNGS